MFAATGWRVGWLIGPPDIIRPTLAATTRIVFATNSPLQEAAAAGLEEAVARKYFEQTVKEYALRRDVLVRAFDYLGLQYSLPEGSYFVLLVRYFFTLDEWSLLIVPLQDISRVKVPEDYPFPPTLNGRGKDFKYGLDHCLHSATRTTH